jgi:hypothetical protein
MGEANYETGQSTREGKGWPNATKGLNMFEICDLECKPFIKQLVTARLVLPKSKRSNNLASYTKTILSS